MTGRACLIVLLTLAGVFAGPRHLPAQSPLLVEHVRVHGNHSTPDAEILRIAAIAVGQPLDPAGLDAARARLETSGRFASIEIRQRSRSIADASRVAIIILVAEHASIRPVDVGVPSVPGPLGRLRSQTMFLPILSVDDGYGVTYGVRTSLVGGRRSHTRLSIPASWGGTRQIAVEVERTFAHGRASPETAEADATGPASGGSRAITRVRGQTGLWRQEHPFFERGQFRRYVNGEVSIRPRQFVAIGGHAALAAVRFGSVDDRMASGGLFAEVDTRRDPLFPRNAAYARTTWARVGFARAEQSGVAPGTRTRWRHDLRGYVGVVGQVVVAARLQIDAADGPLPDYARPILGGADTLRGVRAGFAVGDNLWASSIEARVPFTSVLRSTRLGALAFYDSGATWNHGERWRGRGREQGVGAGVFLVNPFVQLQVSVARGLDRSTRVHVSTGVTF